jgi:hypothetical protein
MNHQDCRWEPATAPNDTNFDINQYTHFKLGKPTTCYRYTDAAGNTLSYALRFDQGSSKSFSFLTYGAFDGTVGWHSKAIPDKRPIFNIVDLVQKLTAPVLVVEGEKTAVSGAAIFPDYVVVTTMGGAQAGAKTDWSPLTGRNVVILADNDDAGRKYANTVASILTTVGANSVRIVNPGPRFPNSWDLADPLPSDVSQDDLLALVNGCDAWPPMLPVPDTRPRVPTLPAKMVPNCLRPWLQDAAERLGVPLEMVVVPALVAVATVCGRKIGIYPKRYDSWLVWPVLWAVIIARPSKRKTPAINEGLRPLRVLEEEAQNDFESRKAEITAEKEVFKALRAQCHEDLRKAVKSNCRDSIDAVKTEIATIERREKEERVTRRRYLVNDSTVEKVGHIVEENPNGIAIYRDELTGFLNSFHKPGHETDRGFYLEGFNGDGRMTVDRMSREVTIKGLFTNIIGGTQPAKFDAYIAAAVTGYDDDGLVQRFQSAIFPDFIENIEEIDRVPDRFARESALDVFRRLDRLDPSQLGAAADENGAFGIRFASDAQAIWDQWYRELQNELPNTPEPAFESHLAKYSALMPKLALIFHLLNVVSGLDHGNGVSAEAAELAAQWCDFLRQHAAKIYHGVTAKEAKATEALAAKIKAGKVFDGISVRDINRNDWSGLTAKEVVGSALEALAACHWLRVEMVPTDGRSKEIVRLHPKLREGAKK